MMQRVILLLSTVGLLVSCGEPESRTTIRQQPPTPVKKLEAPQPSKSASGCQATVHQFLEWYYQNQERLANHLVLSYPKSAADAYEVPPAHVSKSGRYELNEAGLNQYIQLLDSTGFFSESFLASKKQELTRKAKKLASFRSPDGPPPGFDADLLLYTQEIYEPEDINSLREQPTSTSGQPTTFVLPIMDRQWEFTVENQTASCVITSIVFK